MFHFILHRDKEKNSTTMRGSHESAIVNFKLILEDIRRIAEHPSDITEAAMNQTITEGIEKHEFINKFILPSPDTQISLK
jgi:hypothetical protein